MSSSLKARMILEKSTPGGGILTGSCFTNRVGREKDITPWHKRRTPKGAKKDTTAPSGVSDEVTKSSEPIPDLTMTPHLSMDDSAYNYVSPFSPPMPGTSLATAYATGFIQPDPDTSFLEEDFVLDPIWDVDQPSPWTESDAFSGANWGFSTPGDSSFHCQLGSEPTSEGNQYSAPAFRDANMPAQTAPEAIYSPGYPFGFPHQNIYPSDAFSGANWDFSTPGDSSFHCQLGSEPTSEGNQYSAPAFRDANMPAQTAPEAIYSPGYPFGFPQQNIYPPSNGSTPSPQELY